MHQLVDSTRTEEGVPLSFEVGAGDLFANEMIKVGSCVCVKQGKIHHALHLIVVQVGACLLTQRRVRLQAMDAAVRGLAVGDMARVEVRHLPVIRFLLAAVLLAAVS